MKKYLAEFVGTFAVIFIGGGAAVFAQPWVGYVGISLTFGFVVAAAMSAFQDISGAHFNPAVTVAFFLTDTEKSLPWHRKILKALGYVAAQLAGALAAAKILLFAYFSKTGFVRDDTFAANTVAKYPASTALLLEGILSFLFIAFFLETAKREKMKPIAPLTTGLMLTACYMTAMPVTKASLNPARSTAMALFDTDAALPQLWIFWAAPCAAAVLAGLFFRDYRKN